MVRNQGKVIFNSAECYDSGNSREEIPCVV